MDIGREIIEVIAIELCPHGRARVDESGDILPCFLGRAGLAKRDLEAQIGGGVFGDLLHFAAPRDKGRGHGFDRENPEADPLAQPEEHRLADLQPRMAQQIAGGRGLAMLPCGRVEIGNDRHRFLLYRIAPWPVSERPI